MNEIQKVLAYITKGDKLLVFEQPDPVTGKAIPEAGIQVPGGTIETGETPEAAAIREAHEETELHGLLLSSFLGIISYTYDPSIYGINVTHQRYFFHFYCTEDTPLSWQTIERTPSEDPGHLIILQFWWMEINEQMPELIAGQGSMLPKLLERMNQKR